MLSRPGAMTQDMAQEMAVAQYPWVESQTARLKATHMITNTSRKVFGCMARNTLVKTGSGL
jgi:hypothetical protein